MEVTCEHSALILLDHGPSESDGGIISRLRGMASDFEKRVLLLSDQPSIENLEITERISREDEFFDDLVVRIPPLSRRSVTIRAKNMGQAKLRVVLPDSF